DFSSYDFDSYYDDFSSYDFDSYYDDFSSYDFDSYYDDFSSYDFDSYYDDFSSYEGYIIDSGTVIYNEYITSDIPAGEEALVYAFPEIATIYDGIDTGFTADSQVLPEQSFFTSEPTLLTDDPIEGSIKDYESVVIELMSSGFSGIESGIDKTPSDGFDSTTTFSIPESPTINSDIMASANPASIEELSISNIDPNVNISTPESEMNDFNDLASSVALSSTSLGSAGDLTIDSYNLNMPVGGVGTLKDTNIGGFVPSDTTLDTRSDTSLFYASTIESVPGMNNLSGVDNTVSSYTDKIQYVSLQTNDAISTTNALYGDSMIYDIGQVESAPQNYADNMLSTQTIQALSSTFDNERASTVLLTPDYQMTSINIAETPSVTISVDDPMTYQQYVEVDFAPAVSIDSTPSFESLILSSDLTTDMGIDMTDFIASLDTMGYESLSVDSMENPEVFSSNLDIALDSYFTDTQTTDSTISYGFEIEGTDTSEYLSAEFEDFEGSLDIVINPYDSGPEVASLDLSDMFNSIEGFVLPFTSANLTFQDAIGGGMEDNISSDNDIMLENSQLSIELVLDQESSYAEDYILSDSFIDASLALELFNEDVFNMSDSGIWGNEFVESFQPDNMDDITEAESITGADTGLFILKNFYSSIDTANETIPGLEVDNLVTLTGALDNLDVVPDTILNIDNTIETTTQFIESATLKTYSYEAGLDVTSFNLEENYQAAVETETDIITTSSVVYIESTLEQDFAGTVESAGIEPAAGVAENAGAKSLAGVDGALLNELLSLPQLENVTTGQATLNNGVLTFEPDIAVMTLPNETVQTGVETAMAATDSSNSEADTINTNIKNEQFTKTFRQDFSEGILNEAVDAELNMLIESCYDYYNDFAESGTDPYVIAQEEASSMAIFEALDATPDVAVGLGESELAESEFINADEIQPDLEGVGAFNPNPENMPDGMNPTDIELTPEANLHDGNAGGGPVADYEPVVIELISSSSEPDAGSETEAISGADTRTDSELAMAELANIFSGSDIADLIPDTAVLNTNNSAFEQNPLADAQITETVSTGKEAGFSAVIIVLPDNEVGVEAKSAETNVPDLRDNNIATAMKAANNELQSFIGTTSSDEFQSMIQGAIANNDFETLNKIGATLNAAMGVMGAADRNDINLVGSPFVDATGQVHMQLDFGSSGKTNLIVDGRNLSVSGVMDMTIGAGGIRVTDLTMKGVTANEKVCFTEASIKLNADFTFDLVDFKFTVAAGDCFYNNELKAVSGTGTAGKATGSQSQVLEMGVNSIGTYITNSSGQGQMNKVTITEGTIIKFNSSFNTAPDGTSVTIAGMKVAITANGNSFNLNGTTGNFMMWTKGSLAIGASTDIKVPMDAGIYVVGFKIGNTATQVLINGNTNICMGTVEKLSSDGKTVEYYRNSSDQIINASNGTAIGSIYTKETQAKLGSLAVILKQQQIAVTSGITSSAADKAFVASFNASHPMLVYSGDKLMGAVLKMGADQQIIAILSAADNKPYVVIDGKLVENDNYFANGMELRANPGAGDKIMRLLDNMIGDKKGLINPPTADNVSHLAELKALRQGLERNMFSGAELMAAASKLGQIFVTHGTGTAEKVEAVYDLGAEIAKCLDYHANINEYLGLGGDETTAREQYAALLRQDIEYYNSPMCQLSQEAKTQGIQNSTEALRLLSAGSSLGDVLKISGNTLHKMTDAPIVGAMGMTVNPAVTTIDVRQALGIGAGLYSFEAREIAEGYEAMMAAGNLDKAIAILQSPQCEAYHITAVTFSQAEGAAAAQRLFTNYTGQDRMPTITEYASLIISNPTSPDGFGGQIDFATLARAAGGNVIAREIAIGDLYNIPMYSFYSGLVGTPLEKATDAEVRWGAVKGGLAGGAIASATLLTGGASSPVLAAIGNSMAVAGYTGLAYGGVTAASYGLNAWVTGRDLYDQRMPASFAGMLGGVAGSIGVGYGLSLATAGAAGLTNLSGYAANALWRAGYSATQAVNITQG
ncbi:MAG: hypothetical protein PHS46_08130, partial [Candidatus Omnitrophica bacterium]|nr:hypothetical protein [Candidatus Omnitrophota bacterium]